MKLRQLILRLNELYDSYGDIDVELYENLVNCDMTQDFKVEKVDDNIYIMSLQTVTT